jgi:hypothetical protein
MTDFDTNGDGYAETLGFDTDGDGHYDQWQYDTNLDGHADLIGYDTNEDGHIDAWQHVEDPGFGAMATGWDVGMTPGHNDYTDLAGQGGATGAALTGSNLGVNADVYGTEGY